MPEKILSQIPRPLREQYEKGKTAFERNNFDYALAILSGVLEVEPGFYDCRQALRASQFKKAGAGTGFFKKMMGGVGSSPLMAKGQLALRNNPLDALKIAEQILNTDPNSIGAHKMLAEAATAADLPKTAVMSLEIVAKAAPKDEENSLALAHGYAAIGQAEKAEKILVELIRLRPNDGNLKEELKNLSARKTLAEGGYEALSDGKGSYRDILKNKDEAVALEQESRQVKSEDVALKLIRENESRLELEPNNIKLMRTLAEQYTQQKNYDRALEYYDRMAATDGLTDSALQRAIADVRVKKLDMVAAQLDPAAPDYAERSAALKVERDDYLLSECKARADKYPNDLGIRYDLGVLYFQAGKISEAIQELQKAQNHPNKRLQALSYLGQCFAKRNMNEMAARTIQTALKEKASFDDEKKEMIYALGCIFEKMAKKDEAMAQFTQIYEVDIGFKDVAKKVDDFYAGQ